MASVSFDVAEFRSRYPAFASAARFPDATLQSYFDQTACYIENNTAGCLSGDCLESALLAMTAHLCLVNQLITQGKTPSIETSASVGSVSVGLTPPPFGSSQWSWWLNTTPYGQQLQALLSVLSAGGLYIGGRCERAAFRKVGGRF